MAHPRGSVRIGPISLFTLTIILCLAVMAVLTVSTAQATYRSAQKQAAFTTDTYENEAAAQEFVANIDTALAPARLNNGKINDALQAIDQILPNNATREGNTIRAHFTTNSARTLEILLTINEDASYEIQSWKATTQWTDTGRGEMLWSGPAG